MPSVRLLDRFLEPLLAGKRHECRKVLAEAIREHPEPAGLYHRLLWPAMERIDSLYREDRINLATELVDGQHVYVPHLEEEDTPVEWPSAPRAGDVRININTADAAALEALTGIGPALAQRIIDYRELNGPFARPEDVMNVAGVGPALFAQIEDSISTQ